MTELTIRELWRYPVKSMGGERVPVARLDERGLHADRLWAVRDLELGATTTARRLPQLMRCSARFLAEPPPDAGPGTVTGAVVTFPDGRELTTDDPAIHAVLSELVGRPVELRPLPPVTDRAQYRGPLATQSDLRRQFDIPDDEPLPDLGAFPLRKLAELARYATPVGSFADAYPVHLLTTGSLDELRALTPGADFDVRRFRPTVVVEGAGEFAWCGGTLAAGDVALSVVIPTIRCSMPVRAQPGLPAQPDVIRTIKAHSDRCLGVYANVESGGTLAEGDALRLVEGGGTSRPAALAGELKRRLVNAGGRLMPRG